MDPLVTSSLIGAGASGVSSALSLFGKRGPSERDLMAYQHDFWRKSLLEGPRAQMAGLRKAGINPMLAYGSGAGKAPGGNTPGIAAPVDKGTDAAKILMQGLNSAVDMYRAFAEVDLKKEQAKLASNQAVSEARRPALLRAQTEESVAGALNRRQQARLSSLDQQLRRFDIDVRQREAIVAGIQAGLWREADSVIKAVLERLKISDVVVPKVLGTIDRLRDLDTALQDAAGGLFNSAKQWWNRNFDGSRKEKEHWPK